MGHQKTPTPINLLKIIIVRGRLSKLSLRALAWHEMISLLREYIQLFSLERRSARWKFSDQGTFQTALVLLILH